MKRPIKKSVQALLVTASMAPLLACSPEIGIGPSFFQEAGTQLDPGNFGNATLHNQLVQTCRTNAGYKSGGKAGGAAGDPVVVLDPSSSANRPVYRVHCDGRLDGKYALITYTNYIGSAGQAQTVQQADAGGD